MVLPWLLAVNFMNFKYYHIPCSDNVPVPAAVRNGKFSHTDRREASEFPVYVTSVKEGSLHAGTRQAVVTLACDFPVGGTSAAYLYNVHGDAATFVAKAGEANWGGDWGAGPSQIRVRFTQRFLYVDSCGDDDCSTKIVRTYAYRGGRIREVFTIKRPAK